MRSKNYKILAFFAITILLYMVPLQRIYANQLLSKDKAVVDSLLLISFQQFLDVKIEENIKTVSKALNLSQNINYSEGIAKSYFYLARSFSYLGEYNKSLEYLRLCEKEPYTQKKADIHSEVYRIRGQVFNYIGLTNKSINEFKEGLSYASQIEKMPQRLQLTSLAYENLSITFSMVQDYDSMFYYLKKNEEILHTQEFPYNQHNQLNLYTLFGNYYTVKENYILADSFFNKAISTAETNNMKYVSWIYKHRGDMELKRNNPNQALKFYREALDNVKETNMRNEFQAIYKQIAKVYEVKGMLDSMKIYENEAIRIENEQLNEKQKTIENALNIIVEEEKSRLNDRFRSKTKTLTYIGSSLLVLTLVVGVLWKTHHRKKIEKIEKEVESLEARLQKNTQKLIELAKANDSTFINQFMETFPQFTKNIYEKHPDLISSEFWFCAMLFLDFSSKDIAQYNFIEHRSVQIRKSRLRKKLKIDSEVDLYHYIKSFRSDN